MVDQGSKGQARFGTASTNTIWEPRWLHKVVGCETNAHNAWEQRLSNQVASTFELYEPGLDRFPRGALSTRELVTFWEELNNQYEVPISMTMEAEIA